MSTVGMVAIGRNEGQRLRVCLESVLRVADCVVYVDSGSTDGSTEMARSLGAEIVELDMSMPFTAARARNAGFERLMATNPRIDYVQFVDGDCEVEDGWLETSRAKLDADPKVAAVWGRRRERYPERTPYNLLCDIEWDYDMPFGEVDTVGGDTMIRAQAFQQVKGYNAARIAGEERDLSLRLLREGWKLHRIDLAMTKHDAAMTRLSQWWKRSERSGHAFAEIVSNYGSEAGDWVRSLGSIVVWGLMVPFAILALAWPTDGLSFLLLLAYPVQVFRVYRHMRIRKFEPRSSFIYAYFVILGRFPNAIGMLRFHWNRLRGRKNVLIEYK